MGFQSSINSVVGTVLGSDLLKQGKNVLVQKQQQAAVQVKQKQVAKKQQRRNFMSYLQKSNVSSLSPSMQREIASKFTSKQRKDFMDQADANKKGAK